jgi:3,4-dihydroxy 2-butanone 4-phosphate synthase/GTP cyclohydrolase II
MIDDAGLGVFLYVYNRARTSLSRSFDRLVLSRTTPPLAAGASEALRDFGLGAQVLADLGCRRIRLLAYGERRIPGLDGFGIEVVERVPIPIAPRRVTAPAPVAKSESK